MNKKIQEEYLNKIELLKKYNKFYFSKSKPLVFDNKYDELKKEILLLEEKFKFLDSPQSPSKVIGHKPSKNFKKDTHRVPMLSLGNIFSEEDLNNFQKKIFNFLSLERDPNLLFSAEPKIDGISASLTYKNGIFFKGLSRGDGREGEDITANLETIKDIPKKILAKDFPIDIDIREKVIQIKIFRTLKKNLQTKKCSISSHKKSEAKTIKIYCIHIKGG